MGKDTRTRYQGVFARHRKGCAVEHERKCNCRPSYYGVVYDRSAQKHFKTKRFPTPTAARNARGDLLDAIERGETPGRTDLRVKEAVERFIDAARDGVALNKKGRRYKRTAVDDLKGSLTVHVIPAIGARRLSDIRRRDCQRICDELTAAGMSGSRVRSVINAIRSLYRWAQDRELVAHDPASLVRLPAMNATPRDRIATPAEFRKLLDALPPEDALPYALAAYGTARRAEILTLTWKDVDTEGFTVMRLGGDAEAARKYDASLRIVPLVRPLRALLRRVYLAQSRPTGDDLVCPPRRHSKSGTLAPGPLQRRCEKTWNAAKLVPVGLHECRHSAASWLNAAGVNPKVASQLMGHATPEHQPGAAKITLERYTHALPGDLERAREQLDAYLAEGDRAFAATRQ